MLATLIVIIVSAFYGLEHLRCLNLFTSIAYNCLPNPKRSVDSDQLEFFNLHRRVGLRGFESKFLPNSVPT